MKFKSTRFVILAASTLAISYVHAQSTWIGAANGEWGTSSNWDTDPVIPNAIDAVANINTALPLGMKTHVETHWQAPVCRQFLMI